MVTRGPLGDGWAVVVGPRGNENAFDVKRLDEKFARNTILIMRPQNTLNLGLRVVGEMPRNYAAA